MTLCPDTRDSLLVRLSDPMDRVAWEQFCEIYRPVVYRIARARGVQDADAQDIAQRVLMSVADAISSWKRQEGTGFRNWLRRVAKNETLKFLTRRPQDIAPGGSSVIEGIRNAKVESEIEQSIELEYRRQLIRRAATMVRERAEESTWMAFSMTMVDGISIEAAARELSTSVGAVYAARSRIVRRIREMVRQLEDQKEIKHGS